MTPTPTLAEAELAYLDGQRLGRLATVDPNGAPQNNPVGFRYDPASGVFDIYGYNMGKSRKFRNVRDNGKVALVVDDIASVNPWQVRGVEIRGTAEALVGQEAPGGLSHEVIRIHPDRVISWGLESPVP
jgi:pyridoxamine 5'-phosphate oxidase family protein